MEKTTIDMGTWLLPVGLRPNTYWVEQDYDYMINDDMGECLKQWDEKYNEEMLEKYWNHYDHDKRKKFIFDQFKEFYEWDFLDEINEAMDLKMEFNVIGWLNSPKQYNFSTDWMDFDLVIDKEKFLDRVRDMDQEKLSVFLKENYSSYDWFMSNTANNLKDLYAWLKNEDCQEYWAVIWFVLDDNDIIDNICMGIDWDWHYMDFTWSEWIKEYTVQK